jgi:hypothetical protein
MMGVPCGEISEIVEFSTTMVIAVCKRRDLEFQLGRVKTVLINA